jgi:hypothetical protein
VKLFNFWYKNTLLFSLFEINIDKSYYWNIKQYFKLIIIYSNRRKRIISALWAKATNIFLFSKKIISLLPMKHMMSHLDKNCGNYFSLSDDISTWWNIWWIEKLDIIA